MEVLTNRKVSDGTIPLCVCLIYLTSPESCSSGEASERRAGWCEGTCSRLITFRRGPCVFCSPVLGEWSEVRDLQCVCVRLVVLLVDNPPRLFLPVLLYHLLKTEMVCSTMVWLLRCFRASRHHQSMHVHLHALGLLLSIVIWRSCRQNRGGTEVLPSEGWCWRWLSWMAHQEVLPIEREFCFTQSFKEQQNNIFQLIIKDNSYWLRPAWSLDLRKERRKFCVLLFLFFGGGENSFKKWTNKKTQFSSTSGAAIHCN